MSKERIYDPSVLENPADFTLSLDISHAYPTKNADGSNPSASFKVEAPTIRLALNGLSLLNERDSGSTTLLDHLFTESAQGIDFPEDEGAPDSLSDDHEFFAQVRENFQSTDDWREVQLEAEVEIEGKEPETVKITLRAPSYQIMYEAYNEATSNRRLNALVANLMPYAEDEDDF